MIFLADLDCHICLLASSAALGYYFGCNDNLMEDEWNGTMVRRDIEGYDTQASRYGNTMSVIYS